MLEPPLQPGGNRASSPPADQPKKDTRSSRSRATEREVEGLLRDAAELVRKRYESDEFYDRMQVAYKRVGNDLRNRRYYQSLAQSPECVRNPLIFLQRLWGFSRRRLLNRWLGSHELSALTRKQVESLYRLLAKNPDILTHREMFELLAPATDARAEAAAAAQLMKTLAELPPGRKNLERHKHALEILEAGKYPAQPFHHICKELDPTYSLASAPERDRKRDKIRSGVGRLLKRLLLGLGVDKTKVPSTWRARLELLHKVQRARKSQP